MMGLDQLKSEIMALYVMPEKIGNVSDYEPRLYRKPAGESRNRYRKRYTKKE